MKLKHTTHKQIGGQPRATFPTGLKEWSHHYGSCLKIKIEKFATNRISSDDDKEPAEWSDLTPSVPSSPEVSDFVDQLNSNCPVPVADTPPLSPAMQTIGETLEMLHDMETRDSTPGSPQPVLHTPPRSPFDNGMVEDLPVAEPQTLVVEPPKGAVSSTTEEILVEAHYPVEAEAVRITSETVMEINTSPTPARPKFPTAAQKCPRKEFREARTVKPPGKTSLLPSKTLTALQEIRKMPSTFNDILPFAPFARLICELASDLIEVRSTQEAIQALWSGAEAYLLEIFEKANLACMHAGQCTLQPKDIRVVQRILDHDVTIGHTKEAIEAWKMDLLKYKAKRITYKQAKTKEATRRAKLRKIV